MEYAFFLLGFFPSDLFLISWNTGYHPPLLQIICLVNSHCSKDLAEGFTISPELPHSLSCMALVTYLTSTFFFPFNCTYCRILHYFLTSHPYQMATYQKAREVPVFSLFLQNIAQIFPALRSSKIPVDSTHLFPELNLYAFPSASGWTLREKGIGIITAYPRYLHLARVWASGRLYTPKLTLREKELSLWAKGTDPLPGEQVQVCPQLEFWVLHPSFISKELWKRFFYDLDSRDSLLSLEALGAVWTDQHIILQVVGFWSVTQDFPKGCEKPQSTLGYCEEMSSAPVLAVDSSWELFSRGTCPRRSPYQSPCSSRFQCQWGVSLSVSLEVSVQYLWWFPSQHPWKSLSQHIPVSLEPPPQCPWRLHPNITGVSIPMSLECPSQCP